MLILSKLFRFIRSRVIRILSLPGARPKASEVPNRFFDVPRLFVWVRTTIIDDYLYGSV